MGERSGTGNVTDMTALCVAPTTVAGTGPLTGRAICEKLPVLLREVPFVAVAGVFEYE